MEESLKEAFHFAIGNICEEEAKKQEKTVSKKVAFMLNEVVYNAFGMFLGIALDQCRRTGARFGGILQTCETKNSAE